MARSDSKKIFLNKQKGQLNNPCKALEGTLHKCLPVACITALENPKARWENKTWDADKRNFQKEPKCKKCKEGTGENQHGGIGCSWLNRSHCDAGALPATSLLHPAWGVRILQVKSVLPSLGAEHCSGRGPLEPQVISESSQDKPQWKK